MPNRMTLPWVAANERDYLAYTEFNASPCHRIRLEAIVDLVQKEKASTPDLRVLEVGCGTGNISIPLGKLGCPVTAIDIDAHSIELARSRNPFPNVDLSTRSLESLDASPFHVVILTEVLEHVTAYRPLLDGIRRRLTPSGLFIVTVPNGRSLNELACRPSYFLKRRPWGKAIVDRIKSILGARDLTTANALTPHVNFFSLGRLRRLWSEQGFLEESFAAFYLAWPLVEIFASPTALPESCARRDLAFSQCIHPAFSSLWAFALRRNENTPRH